MSFGWSVGDIVLTTQFIANLIARVRDAPREFEEFRGDLELAQAVFNELRSNWKGYAARTTRAGIQQNHQNTIQSILNGIRGGLQELDTKLNSHREVGSAFRHGLANLRFSTALADLRRRLQFHMSSLQLLLQNLHLAQGNRVEDAIRLIREAQEEQGRENETNACLRQGNQNDPECDESLRSFAMAYLPNLAKKSVAGASSVISGSSTTTMSSRDALIERWRCEVERARCTSLSTIISQRPTTYFQLSSRNPVHSQDDEGILTPTRQGRPRSPIPEPAAYFEPSSPNPVHGQADEEAAIPTRHGGPRSPPPQRVPSSPVARLEHQKIQPSPQRSRGWCWLGFIACSFALAVFSLIPSLTLGIIIYAHVDYGLRMAP